MTFETQFLVRVVYKTTGHVEEFWVREFSVETNGGAVRATWESVDDTHKPIWLNVDEVATIWQVGVREVPKDTSKVK